VAQAASMTAAVAVKARARVWRIEGLLRVG